MAGFKAGGGGYGLNKMSTLKFMDIGKVNAEIWHRNLRCEVPECNEQAITLALHGVTMLLCMEHQEAFCSDRRIALALTKAMRTWIQFHMADIARQAYEGQDQEIVLVGNSEDLLSQAREIMSGVQKISGQNSRIAAARLAEPVLIFEVQSSPTVRPTVASLPAANAQESMLLFG